MTDETLFVFCAPRVELNGKVLIDFQSPYIERLQVAVELVRQVWHGNARIKIVPYATSTEQKLRQAKALLEAHAEGIVARKVDGKYVPGKRSSDVVKLKFTKTADCFVVRFGDDGKDNVVLAVYNDRGEPVEVGKVSRRTGDGRLLRVGSVAAVQYAHFSEGGRMVERA